MKKRALWALLLLATGLPVVGAAADALVYERMVMAAQRERDATWTAGQDNQWLAHMQITPVERSQGVPEFVQVVGMTPSVLISRGEPNPKGTVTFQCEQMRTWSAVTRTWTPWRPCARPVFSVTTQYFGNEWATQGMVVFPGGAWARPEKPDLSRLPAG